MANYILVSGDLLDQEVDCIVNSWNRNFFPWWLLIPQGVSRAIRKRAGSGPFQELAKMPVLKLGQAVITSPGRLPYKAIIHVAGINALWRGSRYSVAQSVTNAIRLAEVHGFQSLALPLIGAGSGGFNAGKSLDTICETLSRIESPVQVTVVKFDKPTKPLSGSNSP